MTPDTIVVLPMLQPDGRVKWVLPGRTVARRPGTVYRFWMPLHGGTLHVVSSWMRLNRG